MTFYRIRDWNTHFENAQSRRLVRGMDWFPVPTKHDGKGFRKLMRQPDGVALYGAWILIAAVAAKAPTRGCLVDADGPLTAEDIALKTDADPAVIERALTVLTEVVGWLELADDNGVVIAPRQYEHSPRAVGEQCESSRRAVDDCTPTRQDKTGHNKTEQDSCSEPDEPASEPEPDEADASPVVLEFECVGKGQRVYRLTEAKVAEYRAAFPGVDVVAELRKSWQWLRDSPQRRKTASGMPRFMTNWLSRAQNSGTFARAGPVNGSHAALPPTESVPDKLRRLRGQEKS